MTYTILRSDTLNAVGTVSPEQAKMIVKPYPPGTSQWHSQQAFLSHLKDRRYWLQCDCNQQSLIYIGKSPNYLYLYSLTGSQRPPHEPTCSFSEKNKAPSKPDTKPLKDDEDYAFFPIPKGTAPQKASARTGPSQRKAKENQLFRMLRHIAKAGALHRVSNGKFSTYTQQKQKFLAGAKTRKLNGVPLDELTFFNMPVTGPVRSRLFNTKFDKTHLPTALLIWIADAYQLEDDTLSFQFSNDKTFSIKDTNTSLHHALGNKSDGPFLIAALYRYGPDKDQKNRFTFPLTYVIPIVADTCWMFVDSHKERAMAKALLGRSRYFYENQNIHSVITKPVEPFSQFPSDNITPDFHLNIVGFELFLEVMGFNTWEYIQRKQRTVPMMEEIAPVWEFNAHQYGDHEALSMACFKYTLHIFKHFIEQADDTQ